MSNGRALAKHTLPPDILSPSSLTTSDSPDNHPRAPLPRNSACLQCRRRRIKCDAARPKCGACVRSYAWAVRTGAVPSPVLDCQYAGDTDSTAELSRSDLITKRIRRESYDHASRRGGPEETDDDVIARVFRTADDSKIQEYAAMLQTRLGDLQPQKWEAPIPNDTIWPVDQVLNGLLGRSISPPAFSEDQQTTFFLDEATIFHQAYFPGWSSDLPSPASMGNIVDAFFALVPVLPHIFNRSRFLLRMTLPPFHPDFPNIAILHAICAATGRYVGDVYNGPVNQDPIKPRSKVDNPRTITSFVARHAALGKLAIENNLAEVKNIYETAQALCIMMHHHHVEGFLLEGWLTTGCLNRLLNPLGIMHERYSTDLRPAMGLLLPPPKDIIEKQERRNLLWCAVILDIRMESIGNWSGSISVDDIGVPLPSITESFDPQSSFVPDNDQTVASPDIWMRHSSTEGFCLYAKSMVLLSRINVFTNKRRMRNDYANARLSQEFLDLDAAIATFTMSCPLGMLDPLASERPKYVRTLNDDLLSTQLIIYVLSMKLHEPFAVYHDIGNPHTRRLLTAAREVLGLIYRLSATSFDLRLVCHGEFAIFNAARILVAFLRTELSTGSGVAGTKETLEAEIDVFMSLFSNRSLKFPIGLAVLRSMETLLRFARNPPTGPPRGLQPLGLPGGPPGVQPDGQRRMNHPSQGPSAAGSSSGDEVISR